MEFVTASLDAERMTPRDRGTVAARIRPYLGSLKFSTRRDSTQREHRRMLTKLEEEFGAMPIKALASPRVRRVFPDHAAPDVLERCGARDQPVARAAMTRLEHAPQTAFANRLQAMRPQHLKGS